MSYLSNKTEKKVLVLCHRAIKALEQTCMCAMTSHDDWELCDARNKLWGIIENNGYIVSESGRLKKNINKRIETGLY